MSVFIDADKAARLIARLVDVTAGACGSDYARLVEKYLRRSNKGNIVFCASPVLTKRFLENLHGDSVDDIEAFLECLKPEAAAELAAWAEAVKNGQSPVVREFGMGDFYTERLSDDKIAVAINNFLLSHRTYAEKVKSVIADIGGGSVRIPDAVAEFIQCRPCAGTVSLKVAKSKLAMVCRAECACGFAATVTGKASTILPSILIENNRILGTLAGDHILGRPDDPEAPVTRIGWLQSKSEGIAVEYHLTPLALQSAKDLSVFAEAVRNRKISYDGTWNIGPFRFNSLTTLELEKFAEKHYSNIEAGRIGLKAEVKARVQEAWRTQIKPACGGYEDIYAALPLTARLTYYVIKACKNLSSFNAAWSSGKISVSKDGLLEVDGKALEDIEHDARTGAVRLYKEFTGSAEKARERAGLYNQGVVRKIVELVSANPGKMGATGVSQVLAGSKSQKIMYNRLDRLPGYGSLNGVISQKDIAGMVDLMTSDGLLTVSMRRGFYHSIPVLRVPPDVIAAFKTEPRTVQEPLKKDRVIAKPATIQDAVSRRSWDTLAGMAGNGDWAAEVALNVAAVLWPSGKAAKCIRQKGPDAHALEGASPE